VTRRIAQWRIAGTLLVDRAGAHHVRGSRQAGTVDFSDTPEQVMLREAVAGVARKFGHEYYVECVRTGAKTDELWNALADRGFLTVHIPEAQGGGGGGMSELAIVCEEVAAQGCPLLLILVTCAICGELVSRFGSDEQQRAFLPPIGTGHKMAFAITEPDAGSNSHNISTTAARDGEVYRLRGSKTFVSGADEADWVMVVARTGTDAATGHARLSLLVVDGDSPGIERTPVPVEIRAPEKQYLLFFDDVEVPAGRLVGKEHEGLRQVFYGLNPERITSAALCNGVARYALAKASAYANERSVWGVPIGAHQGVAFPLAEAKVEVELARLMTAKAAFLHDSDGEGLAAGEAANMAKYAAAEAGLHALDAAIQTHGGNGMTSEYGLADLWGIVRLLRIAPVSREMILNFVAQHVLGLPKSY
jgi:alkylation response protein AidB-like acyl-CoA dehydrogenase